MTDNYATRILKNIAFLNLTLMIMHGELTTFCFAETLRTYIAKLSIYKSKFSALIQSFAT